MHRSLKWRTWWEWRIPTGSVFSPMFRAFTGDSLFLILPYQFSTLLLQRKTDWTPIQGHHASISNHIFSFLCVALRIIVLRQNNLLNCNPVVCLKILRKKIIILLKRAFKFWANTRFRLLPLLYVSEFTWIVSLCSTIFGHKNLLLFGRIASAHLFMLSQDCSWITWSLEIHWEKFLTCFDVE